jgi:hypothetical protein
MKKKSKKEKPIDRRIQKTKKLLTEALVALIVEKGYESVTIKDIIEKANVGRSTFYAHFEDKEQLLLWGHDTFKRLLAESVLSLVKGSKGVDINFLFLYQHIQEQHKLVRTLLGEKGGEIVKNQLINIFVQRISEWFGKNDLQKTNPIMFSINVQAAASAMVTLLVQWMEKDMPFTPEEMAKQSEMLLLKMMNQK